MSATNRWSAMLTRRLAVDHGRMRSSLCCAPSDAAVGCAMPAGVGRMI